MLPEEDPLMIQANYAKAGDCFLCCDVENREVVDKEGRSFNVSGQSVLLRCTYDFMMSGIQILEESGVQLMETGKDIAAIENWYEYPIAERVCYKTSMDRLLDPSEDISLKNILLENEKIFIKSVQKGFSAVIPSAKIWSKDGEVCIFLERMKEQYGGDIILSPYVEIKKDSLGRRESRHIVWTGQIMNSSRFIHSLCHTVPKSHITKAAELVEKIKRIEEFPDNYVIDIFESADKCLDVTEINPLSCAMCYVNNSVFDSFLSEVEEIYKKKRIGAEYCYDAMKNPERYPEVRKANGMYGYVADQHYVF